MTNVEKLVSILAAEYNRGQVLFVLDYDGTHAPFVQDPKKAIPNLKCIHALLKLVKKKPNAFIFNTGRPIDELDMLVRLRKKNDELTNNGEAVFFNVAGEHGADVRLGSIRKPLIELTPAQLRFLNIMRGKAQNYVSSLNQQLSVPNNVIFVEHKKRSFALHWRKLYGCKDANVVAHVQAELLRWMSALSKNPGNPISQKTQTPSFIAHPGDCNVEFKLNSDLVSKGVILDAILSKPQFKQKIVVFIGDDFKGTDGYASSYVNKLTDRKGITIRVLQSGDKLPKNDPRRAQYYFAMPNDLGDFWQAFCEQVMV